MQWCCTVHGSATGGDFLQHQTGFGDAHAAAAIGLWNRCADPAGISHSVIKIPWEVVILIALCPVLVWVICTNFCDRGADKLLVIC